MHFVLQHLWRGFSFAPVSLLHYSVPMFRLLAGAVCIGFAPIFVRLVAMAPTPIGFYRCFFAAIALIVVTGLRQFHWPAVVWRLVVVAGLLFALDLYVWHRSVILAGAGVATVLGNTQVLYTALWGIFVHDEKPRPRFLIAVVAAITGVALLSVPSHVSKDLPQFHLGVLFGLLTGIVYTSYILTVRKIESHGFKTGQTLSAISAVSAAALLAVSRVEGTLRLPIAGEWALLIGLALTSQVLGWCLIARSLPTVPVSRAGLILNVQPVVAVVAGVCLLGESFTSTQLLGVILTLVAIRMGGLSK